MADYNRRAEDMVASVMSRNVHCVDAGGSLLAAIKIMFSRRCSCLVVTRDDRVRGILTERDVVRLVATEGDNLNRLTVAEAMTSPVVTIPPDTTVMDVAHLMRERRCRRFPVVAPDGALLGLVTGTDVIAAAKRNLEHSAHRLEREVEIRTHNLKIANHELARVSVTDPLTGLYNRRYLYQHIEKQIARIQSGGGYLSCIMIDLDRFKHINDTYGHDCGDRVLIQVSQLMAGEVRRHDFVARYGGEEFIIVMRCNVEGAVVAAERIRARAASTPIQYSGSEFAVTLSAGVAGRAFPASECTADSLIAEADTALYSAKRAGRNRVIRASGPLAA